ncbi:PAS domain-containing sensor histidine kinase [Arcobacter lacus]|uniref:PAS domain-containing sensor histidine kinase n=1 Tax=Arcobacter lacus TaxID=1912876 RepID=UPI0021BB263B|nr:PAS domain-containing sensor histidine kinase [Arcobacter lacus]MCT7908353.1 PAS domain-containing sensor histidine kinase [Arcobacter lacus]
MRVSFYIKLFLAFILFATLILGFISYLFNNFYTIYDNKQDSQISQNILNQQEDKFLSYLKKYNEKLLLIESIIPEFKNQNEITNFIENVVFEDENIIAFKVVALDSKEILKLFNQKNTKSDKDYRLKNLFSKSYFKEMRVLKYKEVLFHCDEDISKTINFIIRNKDDFYILKIDLENILQSLSSDFSKKTLILDLKGTFLNDFKSSSFKEEDYFSKKVYIDNKKYFTFLIKKKSESKKDFIEQYHKSIIISGFFIAFFIALIFSVIISKLNRNIEEDNKKLDLNIKEKYLKLNENQEIMDNHIMFIRIDKNGFITKVSKAFCYFLGFSEAELIGHDYKTLIHKDIKKLGRMVRKRLNEKIFHLNEIKGAKKDGELFWVDLLIEVIFENDQIDCYNIICTDRTNKKKIENLYNNLNNQIDEYDAIFENVHSGIALIDLDGKFVKLNSKMGELLGYTSYELLTMTCIDVVEDDSKTILDKILKEIDDIGNISKLEKIFIKKDKTPIHLELSLSLLSDKQRVVFVINSLEDKRKLQELNLDLEEKIKQEVEKNIQKDKLHQQEQLKNAKLTYIGSLAAGITHEINTPLTYIKGNLEMMSYDILDLPDGDIKDRMLLDSEKMKEGINRIANIVESMREMAQSSKEVKEKTNIYSTLITSLTMVHNRSKQISRIYLNKEQFDIDNINKNQFLFFSKIQKQRIEQVWVIVINNALDELIKIENYENRNLNIFLYEEENEIIIKFKDNAGGIKEDIINDIFEPFVSSKDHSGMGVGLNIAKKIIEEQNGTITAYNEDEGAVFEIKLKKYIDESR